MTAKQFVENKIPHIDWAKEKKIGILGAANNEYVVFYLDFKKNSQNRVILGRGGALNYAWKCAREAINHSKKKLG